MFNVNDIENLVKYFCLKFGLNKILLFADKVRYFVCGLKISPKQRYYFWQLNSETHFTEELNFALATQHYHFL